MHVGNGAITPECAAITYTAAVAGLGAAVYSLRRTSTQPRMWAMAGALGAAVFAAQMINVPVLSYASAHLVGGVLLAWVLGAELGALTMAVVLTAQALLLGDGGLMALGANIVNMSLLPAVLTAAVRGRISETASSSVQGAAVAATAALAVLGGALLVVAETAMAGGGDLGRFAGQMMVSHSWIGLIEGAATVALVLAVSRSLRRLDAQPSNARLAGAALSAALLIVVALPLASNLPDGYEAAAESTGWGRILADEGDRLASLGGVNVAVSGFQQRIVASVESLLGGGQLLALVAASLVGLTCLALAALASSRRLAPVPIAKR
ncbi:MAG: energy-coupling factor ABC transporter permease [Pirellulaceae bacterium]